LYTFPIAIQVITICIGHARLDFMDAGDPLQYLSQRCAELHGLTDTLRTMSRGAATDISDTFQIAASILSTVLTGSTGKDTSVNLNKWVAEFERMAEMMKREHLTKFESKMQEMSDRVSELNDRLSRLDRRLAKHGQSAVRLTQKVSDQIDRENAANFSTQTAGFKAEEDRLLNEQRSTFAHFEKTMAEELAALSQEYTHRLAQSQRDISTMNTQLQTLIESKETQQLSKVTAMEQENRRVATERGRLSRDHAQRKAEAAQRIAELEDQCACYRALIAADETEQAAQIAKLENEMRRNRETEWQKTKSQLINLDDTVLSLTQQLAAIQEEIKRADVEANSSLESTKADLLAQIASENALTEKLLQEEDEAFERAFRPKREAIQSQISDLQAELLKQIAEAKARNASLFQGREKENELIVEKLDTRIRLLTRDLNCAKRELREIEAARDQAIHTLQHEKQRGVGSVMDSSEQNERGHISEVSELMRQFEQQQRQLFLVREKLIEKREQARAEAIAKRRQEHEIRKQRIIKETEDRVIEEANVILRTQEASANADHAQQISAIQSRILGVKSQIASLQAKADELAALSRAKFGCALSDITTVSQGEEARDRLLKEADELQKSVNEQHDRFELRMSAIQKSYEARALRLKNSAGEKDLTKSSLEEKIRTQKQLMIDLEAEAARLREQAGKFASEMGEDALEYKKSERSRVIAELESVSQQPEEVRQQGDVAREAASAEITSLKARIAVAKRTTEAITALAMKERADTLEEVRAEFKLRFEAQSKVLQDDHERRLEAIKTDRESANGRHREAVQEIAEKYKRENEAANQKCEETMKELAQEKVRLIALQNELAREFEAIANRPCPECSKQKEAIRLLLSKKDEFQRKLQSLTTDAQMHEDQMYKVLGIHRPQPAAVTPELTKPGPPRKNSRSRAQTSLSGTPRSNRLIS
jgi:hypothetical protein